ncbi:spermine synthase-like isoform X2 [Lineus longissimus]|uniref:spermine synthase-like isoform X2 n=1 Tax=Lineus longissimus TaxID=88925 RepID=UPI00315CDA59
MKEEWTIIDFEHISVLKMTCQTIPLFFKVSPQLLQDNAFEKDLYEIGRICLDDVATRQDVNVENGDRIIVMISKNTSHLTMRVYAAQGTVTIDVNYMCVGETKDNFEALVKVKEQYALEGKGDTWQEFILNRLEDRVREYLGDRCLKMETLKVPIRRGDALWTYSRTTAERVIEMEYDELVFSSFSKMQKIQIYQCPLNGNVLYLDGEIMQSERDNEFNELNFGIGKHKRNDYKGKDVLLLGGGIGGGIHSVMQEEPNMVVMCEIDEEVIAASRKYMRKACGTSLDTMEGPHHKIIVGDGLKVLKDAVRDGAKYDFVADDMSMFLVDPDTKERNIDVKWRNETVLSLSKQVLKPDGIYLQALDPKPTSVHTDFKSAVKAVGGVYTVRECMCIPSFLENYFFYEVTFPEANDGSEAR